jgi:hypothetical protein
MAAKNFLAKPMAKLAEILAMTRFWGGHPPSIIGEVGENRDADDRRQLRQLRDFQQ